MPPPTAPLDRDRFAPKRIEVLFEEMAELTGQRNAIDGRLVEIIAEIDGAGSEDGNALWGATGCRSIEALVAWKAGVSPRRAETMVTVAHRIDELPRFTQGLRDGRVSLDQIGVIAEPSWSGWRPSVMPPLLWRRRCDGTGPRAGRARDSPEPSAGGWCCTNAPRRRFLVPPRPALSRTGCD